MGVRILAFFGPDLVVFALGCPNAGVIRTRLGDICTWVSESWRFSDQTWWYLHLGVRMLVLFGPDLVIFALGCPNAGGIRTRLGEICAWVSECWRDSDQT
ncbi:hypothetical protein [Bacillus coreaensis]